MATWHRLGRDDEHPAGVARYLMRDGELHIWCDGTRNLREWRWNLMTRRIGYLGIRVNKVDLEQAQAVLEELYATGVIHSEIRVEHVTVTGISRGGAIAHILGWMLSGLILPSVSVWMYAGKRAGNRKLAEQQLAVNQATKGDIVPLLPPWYASPFMVWSGPWMWPVKAHYEAARAAARWRHDTSKESV